MSKMETEEIFDEILEFTSLLFFEIFISFSIVILLFISILSFIFKYFITGTLLILLMLFLGFCFVKMILIYVRGKNGD
jgi:hypothetical protein